MGVQSWLSPVHVGGEWWQASFPTNVGDDECTGAAVECKILFLIGKDGSTSPVVALELWSGGSILPDEVIDDGHGHTATVF